MNHPKLVVFAGVFFTSFSAVFIRLSDAPSLAIAALRMSLTVVMLVPVYIFGRVRIGVYRSRRSAGIWDDSVHEDRAHQSPAHPDRACHTGENHRRRDLPGRIGRRDLLLCILSGSFLAFHFASWIHSLELTTIASSTVIVNLQPIFVLIGGMVLHRETVSKRAVGFIVMTIAGSVLLSIGDIRLSVDAVKGDLLALGGAVTVAGYMLIGRLVRKRVSATDYVMIVYATSAVILLGMCVAAGIPIFGYPAHEYLLFAAMAFFCTILGHTLFNWALKYLKTAFISTSILGEPVFATILGVVIFTEIPPVLTVAGGLVVLTGLYLFVREERTVSSEDFFDRKAAEWDTNPEQVKRTHAVAEAIRRVVPLDRTMSALDYGAGTGLLTFSLIDSLGSVLAVDTSAEMLEKLEAKRGDRETRIGTRRLNLVDTSIDDRTFDLIVTAMTLHHVEDVESLLSKLYHLLNPGGYIAVADLEREDGSFHSGNVVVHHQGFDTEWMVNALHRAGFSTLGSERVYEIDRNENGRFPVFVAFGRKDSR